MSDDLRIALTFDAEHPDRPRCPPGNAARILETLAARDVTATFFVQGRWAQAYPETARRIGDDGHLVGHHSHYHARMPLLSPDGLAADLEDGRAAILRATGRDPLPWFRCPFGAGHDDPRIADGLEHLGYRDVWWHVELEDWEPHRAGAAIAADAIRGVREHGDGAIVLLHTWPEGTAEGLGTIIDGLRELGGTFVTVDALETLP